MSILSSPQAVSNSLNLLPDDGGSPVVIPFLSGGLPASRIIISALFVALLVDYGPAFGQGPERQLEFFPDKRIFPLFLADGLAHQLSLTRITENREWIGAIGASIPIAQVNVDESKIQAAVAVTIFNRLLKTPGHITVVTVDYKVDFPVDFRLGSLALRSGFGHISCHFADDGIELLKQKSIQYINDYWFLGGAYDVPYVMGNVYANINYSYSTFPVQYRPWLLQVGAELGNIPLENEILLYGAIDLKTKQEVGWGTIQSYQVGVKLVSQSRFHLRVAYTLRTGFEDRGQFYLNKETYNLISAFIDF